MYAAMVLLMKTDLALSSTDRILGFEPSGVGSIPAGPAILIKYQRSYYVKA